MRLRTNIRRHFERQSTFCRDSTLRVSVTPCEKSSVRDNDGEAMEDGANIYSYGYHVDGQLASADYGGGKSERFTWDGLALVRHAFFTGKPQVDGLGHAFLFCNYRASLAKWQTADPLGYPDGWNPLAYCGNKSISVLDLYGAVKIVCRTGSDEKEVSTAEGVAIINTTSGTDGGGRFSVLFDFADGYGGEITVYFNVSIEMDAAMRHDSAFSAGDTSRYAPHSGAHDNSLSRDPVYEAILAHERAHAMHFFNVQLPLLSSFLITRGIDNGGLGIQDVKILVSEALSYVWASESEVSNKKANNAVYEWFSRNSRRWERIHDLGEYRVWRVKE